MSSSRRTWLRSLALGTSGVAAVSCAASNAKPTTGEGAAPRGPRRSDRLPDLRVVDQDGIEWRSYSDLIADKPVLCSFFYCNCDGSCPGTAAVLRRMRADLSPHVPDLRVLSFTLAPKEDDVNALARHASALGVDREDGLAPWHFLTGAPVDLEALRLAFGYRDLDPYVDADRKNHAALITFGHDARDRWGAMPSGIEYYQLRRSVVRAIAPEVGGLS